MTTQLARLLLGGAMALAVGGCSTTMPSGSAVSSPTPGASPSPPPSSAATAGPSPSVAPGVTPPPDGSLTVDLFFHDDPAGRSIRLLAFDDSRRLVEARGATAAEQALPTIGAPEVDPRLAPIPGDPSSVVLVWTGLICDTTARLRIDKALATIEVEGGPVEPCDAMGVGRGVVLRFDGPIDPAAIATSLVPGAVVEVMPRREAEAEGLARLGGHEWVVVRSLLAEAVDLDPRLQPADRLVWAVSMENRGLPGSCPSLGPGVDTFTAEPCVAAGWATAFLDARTGASLGVAYITF